MGKLYDTYITAIKAGDDFFREISFDEYVYMNMKLFKSKMFNVDNTEDSINKAMRVCDMIWNSSKKGKISFTPGSLKSNVNNLNFKWSNWIKYRINIEDKFIEAKYTNSYVDAEEVIKTYDKLKIKDGYTLQIYKVIYEGREELRLFAFEDKSYIKNIRNVKLNYDGYDGIEVEVKGAEKNYLSAIEFENSPQGYLEMVLLKNDLDKLCGIEDNYEIIDRRIKIDNGNFVIDEPSFYYNEVGNPTIEYFKKYNTYNEAYKRVINVFDIDKSSFKVVDQIVYVFMQ